MATTRAHRTMPSLDELAVDLTRVRGLSADVLETLGAAAGAVQDVVLAELAELAGAREGARSLRPGKVLEELGALRSQVQELHDIVKPTARPLTSRGGADGSTR